MPDYLDRESYVGLNFDDRILKTQRGYYARVSKYMKESEPSVTKWMLSSTVEVEAARLDPVKWGVHFFYDGHTVLWDSPSIRLSGPDIACLRVMSIAMIAAGWKRPEPALHEIDANPIFWKQLWDTGIVDSRQMNITYGNRRIFGE
jgi:hypothetical protein